MFSPESTGEDAHVVETQESRSRRGAPDIETDPHVLDELKTVADGKS